jgi:hypothetical protein
MPKKNKENNDSENETDKPATQNVQQRKRGRPKKNDVKPKQKLTSKLSSSNKDQEEEQLILHIPLYDNDGNSSDKNLFTMKDESETGTEQAANANSIKLIESLTESEGDNSHESDCNVEHLLFELQKRDVIINKLKSQLATQKTSSYDNIPIFIKNKDRHMMDLNLFSCVDGKQLVDEHTDIACWYCSCTFDTAPCFIPERYNSGKFHVFGCFCTYNCALKFNSELKDCRVSIRESLIKQLCIKIYGEKFTIHDTHDKFALSKFGGPLSIEEFRNNKLLCTKEYVIKLPPLIQLAPIVEEKYRDPSQNPKKSLK